MDRLRPIKWMLWGWTALVAILYAVVVAGKEQDLLFDAWVFVALWMLVGVPLLVSLFAYRNGVTARAIVFGVIGAVVAGVIALGMWFGILMFATYGSLSAP